MTQALRDSTDFELSGYDAPDIEDAVIMAMSVMTAARHHETGRHITRTQQYVRVLAQALAAYPAFSAMLDHRSITVIYKAAALHDIGKVGVPDHILLKPGPLAPHEFEEMKRHTVYGRDAIMAAKQRMRAPRSFLYAALNISYYHHEKWDGTGYPEGLAGNAIPLPARLMAVADVYDALTSARPYKEALSHAKAMRIIANERDAHFDPALVDALKDVQGEFATIAAQFADTDNV